MIYLIWTAVLLVVIYIYFKQTYSRFDKNDVKYIPPMPIVGNTLPLIKGTMHISDELVHYYYRFPEERFVGKYDFTVPVIIVRDLELIKKITVKDFENFLDHRGFGDEKLEPIFSRNLFAMKGNEWKDMRSTLSPAFTSSKIRHMVPFMEEVGVQMMARLNKRFEANNGQPIEIDCTDLTTRYATDVIASCAFGIKVDSYAEGNNEFHEMGKEASQFKTTRMLLMFAYNSFPFLSRMLQISPFSKHVSAFFKALVMDTMKKREADNTIRPDMIHLLMEAQKGQLKADEKFQERDAGFATVDESAIGKKQVNRTWKDNDLVAQALVFFIAGFETVSSSISFALRELALNKDIQDRLYEEIKEDVKKNNGKLDYTTIQNLRYLDNVVSEILRLWPTALQLDRICTKPYNLGRPNKYTQKEYIVQKGEQLRIPVWCIHRDPEYFPEPEKFDPDRFSDERKYEIKPMTYLPFGSGPRNCIGSRFALCEIKVVLYLILLNMEVLPSEKTAVKPVISKKSFLIRFEGGNYVNFKPRK